MVIIIIAVIFVVIFFLAIILLFSWSYVVKQPPTFSSYSQYSFSGFGSRCSIVDISTTNDPNNYYFPPCETGLECIFNSNISKEYGFCLKSIGTTCNNLYECVPTANVCAGVCAFAPFGGLGQTCSNDLSCTDPDTVCDEVKKKCVYKEGVKCTSTSQCRSGILCSYNPNELNEKYCQPRFANGLPCYDDFGCYEGSYCSNGFCQSLGIETGKNSAVCTFNSKLVPSCDSGLTCNTIYSNGISQGYYGTCIDIPLQWPSTIPCSAEQGCKPPSICFEGKCIMPRKVIDNVITSDPDVNNCQNIYTTQKCIKYYQCNNGMCIPTVKGVPFIDENKKYGIVKYVQDSLYWEPVMNFDLESPTIDSKFTSWPGYFLYSNRSINLNANVLTLTPNYLIQTDRIDQIYITSTSNIILYNIKFTTTGKMCLFYFYQNSYSFELIDISTNINLIPTIKNTIGSTPNNVNDIIIDDRPINSTYRIFYSSKDSVWGGYFESINNNSIYTTLLMTVNNRKYNMVVYPYLYSKNLPDYNSKTCFLTDSSNNIKTLLNNVLVEPFVVPEEKGYSIIDFIVSNQISVNLSQLTMTYLCEKNANYYVGLISSNIDVILPGYFDVTTKITLIDTQIYCLTMISN